MTHTEKMTELTAILKLRRVLVTCQAFYYFNSAPLEDELGKRASRLKDQLQQDLKELNNAPDETEAG